MYNILLHAHSGLRWVILLLIIEGALKSTRGWIQKREYSSYDNKISLFALIGAHTQLVIGFALYFISPKVRLDDMAGAMKDPLLRFFTVEHVSMMIIAVALVTIGRIKSKKQDEGWKKHKTVSIFFLLALIIIIVAVPWPFSKITGSWF